MKAPYTQEEFDNQLKTWGLTLEELKARLRRDRRVKKLVNKDITSKINITDADVANFYTANRGSFNLPARQVHMAQILVTAQPDPNVHNLKNDKAKNDDEARRKIQQLEFRLKQGEDFAMMAQGIRKTRRRRPMAGIWDSSAKDRSIRQAELKENGAVSAAGADVPDHSHASGISDPESDFEGTGGTEGPGRSRVQQSIRSELLNRKDELLKTAYYDMARNEAKVVNNMSKKIFGDTGKGGK